MDYEHGGWNGRGENAEACASKDPDFAWAIVGNDGMLHDEGGADPNGYCAASLRQAWISPIRSLPAASNMDAVVVWYMNLARSHPSKTSTHWDFPKQMVEQRQRHDFKDVFLRALLRECYCCSNGDRGSDDRTV